MRAHITGYTFEADHYCVGHTVDRFGQTALDNGTATDSFGNEVHACFSTDRCDDCYADYCSDCLHEEIQARWGLEKVMHVDRVIVYPIGTATWFGYTDGETFMVGRQAGDDNDYPGEKWNTVTRDEWDDLISESLTDGGYYADVIETGAE